MVNLPTDALSNAIIDDRHWEPQELREIFSVAQPLKKLIIAIGFEYAAYIPAEDKIVMPDAGRFDSFEGYAVTTFHELGRLPVESSRYPLTRVQ